MNINDKTNSSLMLGHSQSKMPEQLEYPVLRMVKGTDNVQHRLVIPKKVENIIRYHCNRLPSTEWSGVLFYKTDGSFEEGLTITCKDFLLMDIGSAGSTSFKYDKPDVAVYMADNPELFDCYMGLMHSHNRMEAFFSGTDQNTLKLEGNDMNNFLSVVVNNAGNYVASITRKVKDSMTVLHDLSYPFYEKGTMKSANESHEAATYVEAFPLLIQKEEVSNSFLDKRFSEINSSKRTWVKDNYPNANAAKMDISHASSRGEMYLPFKDEQVSVRNTVDARKEKEEETGTGIDPYTFFKDCHCDEGVADYLAKQLLSGSPFMSSEPLDRNMWAEKVDNIYSKRFPDVSQYKEWLEPWLDFLLEEAQEGEGLYNRILSMMELYAISSYDIEAATAYVILCDVMEVIKDIQERRDSKKLTPSKYLDAMGKAIDALVDDYIAVL